MVIGIGVDIVEIQRIQALLERYGHRFCQRLFTVRERQKAQQSLRPAASLAKRFAAKEALVKALGTGFQQGMSFQDIEVSNNVQGQPTLQLQGYTLEKLQELVPVACRRIQQACIHLSLSDSRDYAVAQVLIELILRTGEDV